MFEVLEEVFSVVSGDYGFVCDPFVAKFEHVSAKDAIGRGHALVGETARTSDGLSPEEGVVNTVDPDGREFCSILPFLDGLHCLAAHVEPYPLDCTNGLVRIDHLRGSLEPVRIEYNVMFETPEEFRVYKFEGAVSLIRDTLFRSSFYSPAIMAEHFDRSVG